MTIVERILLAAAKLAKSGAAFSAEDLVVTVWTMYPDQFGLQGYPSQYPDSNRVLTKIMGAKSGLRSRGWIERVGTKRYKLTELGRLEATRLSRQPQHRDVRRLGGLSRELTRVLDRLLSSRAFEKYRAGLELNFGDVASAWAISARSTANQLKVRSEEAKTAVEVALEQAQTKEVLLPGHLRPIKRRHLRELLALHDHIETRFSAELDVIKGRVDERRL